MRWPKTLVFCVCVLTPALAQQPLDGPTSEKAQKSFKDALEHERKHELGALDDFKKADKQDDGHCLACQKKVVKYAIQLQDWKAAQNAASAMVAEAMVSSQCLPRAGR